MAASLTATGLSVDTQATLVANYTAAFQTIYGADIDLDSDTPDGQMMNIFIQSILDMQDLLVQIYNNFDPDNAIGVVLDQRVAINGIQRQAGTYTITNVTVVTSQVVNLYGLDQVGQPVYTVADSAGNQWNLITTQIGLASGTNVLAFQSATPGANVSIPNSITVPVTIVLGVTSVNNPTSYTTLGINEESDAVLKVRRQQSVALGSQGFLAGLLAALDNISGMVSAQVIENNTDSTVNSIPSHSIWVIVDGSGANFNLNVATAIYNKRNAGCGMYGSIHYTITQVDGSPFVVSWDTVTTQPLYIEFTVQSISGGTISGAQVTALKQAIVTNLVPGVYATVNVNELATVVQAINSDYLITLEGLSVDNVSFYALVTPSAQNKQFVLSTGDIAITAI